MDKKKRADELDEERRKNWAIRANELGSALEIVVASVGPLDFADRRRVLRWACDAVDVSAKNLAQNGD